MITPYAPGSLVSARDRDWVVLPQSSADMLVLRPLGGADDEIAAVFPATEQVRGAQFAPPSATDLGDARAAGLLRSALRIGFRSGAGPFRSLAGIAVEPRAYQLVPLMMALRQATVRILISDDVGIGKTVEAGLIAAELLAQGSARALAVLCSPALTEQWQAELRTKFGIDAELVLSSTVAKLERSLDLGQSLFDRHPHVIVSTDFIKSARHRDDFVRHCPDLVIVDEAHTCVAPDDGGSLQSQLRYELLQRVAADPTRHLLLVTATPHSGNESAFRNLLGLVKPELATVELENDAGRRLLARHFVHRRRADVRRYLTTSDGLHDDNLAEETVFPSDRQFKDETYQLSPVYRALLDDAIEYTRERVTTAGQRSGREGRIAWWSAIALLRSLVSSPRAAAQTLRTRSAAAAAGSADEADRLGASLVRDAADGDALEGLDVAPGARTDEPTTNGGAARAPDRAENRLGELADRAARLEGTTEDWKLAALVTHVKALLRDGYHPIVFCRYIPTAEYVAQHLDGNLGKRTVVRAVTGTLSPHQRLERIEELAEIAGDDPRARRVLIATDCLSEGVNLQHHFDAVVHYDLAWNPTRHDQREGRVDRYGQRRDVVRVITLYGSDNGIDGKILDVLIRKHRQIRKDLGVSVSVPDATSIGVTDAIVEWLLIHGRKDRQGSLLDLKQVGAVDQHAPHPGMDWNSATERERKSRSRFAQRSIRPEQVAREVAAIRDTLGRASEVHGFVRQALHALDGVLRDVGGPGDFSADVSGTPAGLRDALTSVLGSHAAESGRPVVFRTTAAVARGEAALVRTDPAVVALASYVLDAALDGRTAQSRPARRCGVIRTRAVRDRVTLLLVRYRLHLTLPSRNGVQDLVAEDARLLAFEGAAANARWLTTGEAVGLLDTTTADENTDPMFGERTVGRILDGLPSVAAHLDGYGDKLAAELLASHRRVRYASGEIVRGLAVTAQKPADILGVYVYLPVSDAAFGAPAGGAA